jgi:aspartate 1-decarboxylase
MQIEVLKSKIHRVTVTEANLNYMGSITIDEDLMDAANVIENEKVQVVNINNGERLDTYVIKGEYAMMDMQEARHFKPVIILPDTSTNRLMG